MNQKEWIVDWLKTYALKERKNGFIIGVSGGIDSAVSSTLCALTGLSTIALLMPIHQAPEQTQLGLDHVNWLQNRYKNTHFEHLVLNRPYDELLWVTGDNISDLAKANTRSRLRMVTLYALANTYNMLVCGTGNKVEDYGVGFFTKFGDGGVDISPIGELTKTEVWQLGRELGILKTIIEATPTDGLHPDNRSDESQIGASYAELEWAMDFADSARSEDNLTERQKQVLDIYLDFHKKNAHKMQMPPICPPYKG